MTKPISGSIFCDVMRRDCIVLNDHINYRISSDNINVTGLIRSYPLDCRQLKDIYE